MPHPPPLPPFSPHIFPFYFVFFTLPLESTKSFSTIESCLTFFFGAAEREVKNGTSVQETAVDIMAEGVVDLAASAPVLGRVNRLWGNGLLCIPPAQGEVPRTV